MGERSWFLSPSFCLSVRVPPAPSILFSRLFRTRGERHGLSVVVLSRARIKNQGAADVRERTAVSKSFYVRAHKTVHRLGDHVRASPRRRFNALPAGSLRPNAPISREHVFFANRTVPPVFSLRKLACSSTLHKLDAAFRSNCPYWRVVVVHSNYDPSLRPEGTISRRSSLGSLLFATYLPFFLNDKRSM